MPPTHAEKRSSISHAPQKEPTKDVHMQPVPVTLDKCSVPLFINAALLPSVTMSVAPVTATMQFESSATFFPISAAEMRVMFLSISDASTPFVVAFKPATKPHF